MKKMILIIIFIFMTGCSDYRELSDMTIISACGIAFEDDKYIFYIQAMNAKGNNESTGSTLIYSASGKTIHEAARNTILKTAKKVYLGHIESIIIDEKISKEGVKQVFDFFLRDPESSKDFKMFTVKDSTLKEIFDTETKIITISGVSINEAIETAVKKQGSVSSVSFDEFVATVLKPGIDPVLPVLTITESKSENKKIDPTKELIILKSLSVYDDDKLSDYLSVKESIGYNILMENATQSVYSFDCKDKSASIEILKNKSNFTVDIENNILIVNVDLTGALSEINCNIDITKENNVKKVEDMLKKSLKNTLSSTIEYALKKNTKSDFIGIEEYIYRNNYKYYKKNEKDMEDIIKKLDYKINTKVKFIQKGSIIKGNEKK